LHHVGHYYATLSLNRELVSRAKLCPVSVFPHAVEDCPQMRKFSEEDFPKNGKMVNGSLIL